MIPHRSWKREAVIRWFAGLLVVSTGVGNKSFAQSGIVTESDLVDSPNLLPPGSVLVVCPPVFRESLQPWINQRTSEQLAIEIIDSQPTAERLQSAIQDRRSRDMRYVLLVGDSPVIGQACDTQLQVPSFYPASPITEKWGSTPSAASDWAFGDLDNDGEPDAAVGRMPVRGVVELTSLVQRILAYEKSTNFGSWRGEVQLTGGIGGFGMLVDAAIESVTRTLVTTSLPTEIKTTVAYASDGHLFYPKARPFTEEVLARYERGARFWVYAGHGWIDSLDRVPQTREGVPVLDTTSVGRLSGKAGVAPIALMLACYTGAFDAPQQSLAERMLLAPAGPVTVFAGSRMTMPYGNTVTAVGLIDGVYRERRPRLGDAWLTTLQVLHREDETDKTQSRTLIDSLAAMISPAGTVLADERREHAAIYNLLGDPTLRLHHPYTVAISAPTGSSPSDPVMIDVTSPIDGELRLTLDRPLGAATEGDPNDTTVASLQASVQAGQMGQHKIQLPAGVQGPLIIRALVEGVETWATAATRTLVR